MKDKPVTIVTTAARAAALRQHLAPSFLGHTPIEELIRGLLADVDRALEAQR